MQCVTVKRPLVEPGNELYEVAPSVQESDLCEGGLFVAYLQQERSEGEEWNQFYSWERINRVKRIYVEPSGCPERRAAIYVICINLLVCLHCTVI